MQTFLRICLIIGIIIVYGLAIVAIGEFISKHEKDWKGKLVLGLVVAFVLLSPMIFIVLVFTKMPIFRYDFCNTMLKVAKWTLILLSFCGSVLIGNLAIRELLRIPLPDADEYKPLFPWWQRIIVFIDVFVLTPIVYYFVL